MNTTFQRPDGRSWYRRHKGWTAVGVVFLLGFGGVLLEDDDQSAALTAESSSPTTPTARVTVTATRAAPTQTSTNPATAPAPTAPSSSASTPVAQVKVKPTKDTPQGVPAAAQLAAVLAITDGDTLHVQAHRPGSVLRSTADVTVRLLEIDTPETLHPTEPVGCFGPAASKALTRLAPPGSQVWVMPDQELLDPYDRTLLYMWNTHGTFVNRSLVRRGFAKASLYEPNDRYIDVMRDAERQAHAANAGLWGACAYFGAPLTTATPAPTPDPAPQPRPVGNCDSAYPDFCIPPAPPDLDCADVNGTNFTVEGTDPHGFDGDGDGIGCVS